MATKTVNAPSGSQGAESVKPRYGTIADVTVDTVLADCDVIDIREWRDIAVKPNGTINSLSVYAAESVGGTYVLVDSIGTNGAVTVVAAKWNVLDITKIAPFGFIKLVSSADGTVQVVAKT